MKVTLIDYGAGNVPSVERALRRLGAQVEATNLAQKIAAAQSLVLPGVGHCAALITALDARGLREPLIEAIGRGAAFLGICLGLQALYESSEEAPTLRGLGLLPGRVTRLPDEVKLPHMGWNTLKSVRASRLLESVSSDAYFYFAHSFAAPAAGNETVAVSAHGREFVAVLEKGNIRAVQFHPEKSGEAGAQVLRNFLRAAA
ncbi:MAG TPA: imidazole glycerol phosphate synthase subunit HisH [Candidatus Sulfotelmatobacter sp.]|nr:imidazole glycerol phosphate synthase subunit HisH [Candidatus Sulfotelmatobacter sp.]